MALGRASTQMPADEPFARFRSEDVYMVSLQGREHEKGVALLRGELLIASVSGRSRADSGDVLTW
jgi:hypothetical protein